MDTNNLKYTFITVVDCKFYNFLKCLANSIRVNSPNIKLIVHVIGFKPSIDDFRNDYYENVEFIYDDKAFAPTISNVYEYDKNSISKINSHDEISIYSNNICISNIVNHLNTTSLERIFYIDADCMVRKDISILESKINLHDVGLLVSFPPPNLLEEYKNKKYYQFGFVPMKVNDVVKSFFSEFKNRVNMNQRYNEPLFNEVIIDYKDKLNICEFDDSIVCGAGNVFKDDSLIWHPCGANKYWDMTFRKEFYKYLALRNTK